MPSLTIHPPRDQTATQPQLPPLAAASNNTFSYASQPGQASPVAPEYSPITPRAQPALPVTHPPPLPTISDQNEHGSTLQTPEPIAETPTAEFIPEPQPQPFSGEDATDAIALRAAISSLQFQKKKAQDDIRVLEKIKRRALDEPEHFRSELAAGRLHERKPRMGDLQAILDHEGSSDDDDEVVLGREDDLKVTTGDADTQPTNTTNGEALPEKDEKASFDRIPGPQNVVRMPYVNWDKYHITGEPLDSTHEQQRKWPGNTAYGRDRGREYTVAAPYSPWLDSLDGQGQGQQRMDRSDSMAVTTPTTAMTPNGTISEHPMETRRRTNQ